MLWPKSNHKKTSDKSKVTNILGGKTREEKPHILWINSAQVSGWLQNHSCTRQTPVKDKEPNWDLNYFPKQECVVWFQPS